MRRLCNLLESVRLICEGRPLEWDIALLLSALPSEVMADPDLLLDELLRAELDRPYSVAVYE